MSINKTKRGRYEVRCRENGHELKRRFKLKKDAEDFGRSIERNKERRRNGLPMQGAVTYKRLTEIFTPQHDVRSSDWFDDMLSYSIKQFGSVEVRQLLPDRIGAWLHGLPLSPKTKKHIRDSMRQVLDAGVEWGYLARNPVRTNSVKPPKQVDPDIRPFASWAEVDAVASHAEGYESLVRFACATGLRPEEWIPLRWSDFSLRDRTLLINKVAVDGVVRTDEGKTEAAFRTLHLQQRALDALAALPTPLRRTALIFPARKGGYINLDNWRRRVWRPAIERSGVADRPLYQCRHTFASLALAAGADLYWVSRQLGHKDIRITVKHYARFERDVHDRNVQVLDAFSARADAAVSDSCHEDGETQDAS